MAKFTISNDVRSAVIVRAGISIVGRCTVKELTLNRAKLIEYRECIIPFGTHPPDN
jgi:hypothetical protein